MKTKKNIVSPLWKGLLIPVPYFPWSMNPWLRNFEKWNIFSALIKTRWNIFHLSWFNFLLWQLSTQNGRQSVFQFGLRPDSFMLLDITLVIQKSEWEESLDTLDFLECSFTIFTLDINLSSIRKRSKLRLNFKINSSIISFYYILSNLLFLFHHLTLIIHLDSFIVQ